MPEYYLAPIRQVSAVTQMPGEEGMGQMGNPAAVLQAESPFAFFLDKAIGALAKVSATERKADQLIAGYIEGKVDVSDVAAQVAKANLEIQVAVSTGTAVINAWREIQQMQV